VQGRDGSFYGTTEFGGRGNVGTVFRLTIMPEFQAVTLTNRTLSLTWKEQDIFTAPGWPARTERCARPLGLHSE
jgi:uncharacterized repeat protein (TIGR03803 family)